MIKHSRLDAAAARAAEVRQLGEAARQVGLIRATLVERISRTRDRLAVLDRERATLLEP